MEVEILDCDRNNESKGLSYTHNYKIPDNDDYNSEQKKEYNLSDAWEETLIKSIFITFTPLLLTQKKTTTE